MKFKRGLSLFLAVATAFSMMPSGFVHASGAAEWGHPYTQAGISAEAPGTTPVTPATSPGGSEETNAALVKNLQLSYKEEKGIISLTYETVCCDHVIIYVNGRELEDDYTGTAFDFDDADEGETYVFRIVPYNAEDKAGTAAEASFTVPYKQASVTEVDAEYNLEKKVLIVDWWGENIAYADVYQDDQLMEEHVTESRLIREIDLEAKSKHTYRVVPYNKNGDAGIEKSYLLEVDDYVATILDLKVDYVESARKIVMSWEDSYTEYVEICLNDETIVEKFTGKSYVINCELQPGAAYVVTILPYNYKQEAGEEEEEDVSFGYFDVPDEVSAKLASIPIKNAAGEYTGFSRPELQVRWEAQARAYYEIYRAQENKRSAFRYLATVKADQDGMYTYVDKKAGYGTYYYMVRRKIAEDDYIDQELYTALSDAESVHAVVPKPGVKALLCENGKVALTMTSSKEFVSGYDIYRKTGSGGYKFLKSVSEDSYLDDGLAFGKTYRYKVKAYYYDAASGKKVNGRFSDAAAVKNTIGLIEAEAVAIAADQVKVAWTPTANADGYEVYYRSNTQGDSYALYTKTQELSLKVKLKKSGTHYFMVKAYRKEGKGRAYFSSAEVSVKMGFTAPTGFQVKKTSFSKGSQNLLIQKDQLSWNRVYGAKGYYIEVYDKALQQYRRVAKIKKNSKTSYTVSNPVTAQTGTITYRISAYLNSKKGTKVKKGGTLELAPQLGMVKKVKAVKSGNKVKISFKRVMGAERYQVYRSNGRTMILVGETAGTAVTDQGLDAGVSYKYYVQAVNLTQNLTGVMSEAAAYSKKLEKAGKLTLKNKKAGTIDLSWNASRSAQKYIVYFKTSSGAAYQKLAEVSAPNTTYHHKVQTAGSVCQYKVTAVQINGAGVWVESGPVTAEIRQAK